MAAAPKLILVYTKDQELNRVQQNTAEAFRHLANSLTASADIVDITFTATDPGAGTPVPLVFNVPDSKKMRGVEVINCLNITSPSTFFQEAVTVQGVTQVGYAINIPYVTGLTPGTMYKLTLRVTYA